MRSKDGDDKIEDRIKCFFCIQEQGEAAFVVFNGAVESFVQLPNMVCRGSKKSLRISTTEATMHLARMRLSALVTVMGLCSSTSILSVLGMR